MGYLEILRTVEQRYETAAGAPTIQASGRSEETRATPPTALQSDTHAACVPEPPICPGWLIAYRAVDGHLVGGEVDRLAGTVTQAEYRPPGWRFQVANGAWVPMAAIRSVAKTDPHGQVVAAWEVRAHGLDGGIS